MIRVYNTVIQNKRICEIEYGRNLFLMARNFFRNNPDKRDTLLEYCSLSGETRFLGWESNHHDKVVFWVDDLWDYDLNDERIDDELLLRADIFHFYEADEYSVAIASLILERYPEKEVFFHDARVKDFFPENQRLHVVKRWADVYKNYKYSFSKSIMIIDGGLEYRCWTPFDKNYSSVSVMQSLFWMCNTISYGPENPDKAIMLISYPLEESGLIDMIKYALFVVMTAKDKTFLGMKIVPFIDFSRDNHGNIITEKLGVNAWTELFEQVSDITSEEVYKSKNVICIDHKLNHYNIYIHERMLYAYWNDMFSTYLHLKKPLYEEVNKRVTNFFETRRKTLGIAARGTDYAIDIHFGNDGHFMRPKEFVRNVEQFFATHDYERIFLSTEDESFLIELKKSSLWEYTIAFDRERVDYTDEVRYVASIFRNKETPLLEHNIIYLTELIILSKCNGLIANFRSGGVSFAIGMNNDMYEDCVVY